MKITTRLTLNTFISLGAVILILISIVWSFREIIIADRNIKLADEMRDVAFDRILLRDEYLLYQERRSETQWHAKTEALQDLLVVAATRFDQEKDRTVLQDAQRDFKATNFGFSKVMEIRTKQYSGTNTRPGFSEAELQLISQVFMRAYSLNDNINRLNESAHKASKDARNRGALIVLIFISSGIIAIAINSAVIAKTLAKRVTALGTGVELIGAGDLDYRIAAEGNDELSTLARASNEMAAKLKQSYTSVESLQNEITGRKRVEEALRASEELFRIASETSNDVVYEWDLKQSVHWFGSIDEMLGYEPGEFPRTLDGWAAAVHPEDLSCTMAAVQAHLDGPVPYAAEYRIRRKDGGYRWWAARGAAARTTEGTPVRLVGTVTDITDRKQATDALRESEEQFRTLADTIPNLAWWANGDGYITWYNRRWYEYTGTTPEQMAGWGWQSVHDPKMLPKVLARWKESIATGEPFDMEFPLRGADGVFRTFLTRVLPLKDSAGQVFRWFGTNTDISVLKQAEERLNRVLADLERSNEELEQFAYVASHDLQEPLRMISSYTQLLAKHFEGRLDDKTRKYIDYAVDGAIRMQQLINDLLAYSRVNTKGKPPETIGSHSVLGEAIRNLYASIEESQAIVTNDDLPTVRVDATQLQQLFQNLISNAIKFRGSDFPRIHVAAADLGSEWCFSVKDNGIGIDAQYAEKVFVIFQRLHTRQEYSGTGIGLAVCKRIVERHGGRIWFESALGKGSTFYFTLPK